MARLVFERDTDVLFASALVREAFATAFLGLILPGKALHIRSIHRQTRHRGSSGSIDLELTLSDGTHLLIENKIDAGYSVNQDGTPQPERYAATIEALRAQGMAAHSILLAPQVYLSSSRFSASFDRTVAYEQLLPHLSGTDHALLIAAIAQAQSSYEPVPNTQSADFFVEFSRYATQYWPSLVLKRNPNGNGVRPTESRTIYFDVPRTLREWPGVPRVRMSLQCWDSFAPSASVKIMIPALGKLAHILPAPRGLRALGGYLRPAGQSLGCVIDTPRLDTQRAFKDQCSLADQGLSAADRLRCWWSNSPDEILALCSATP